MVAYNFATLVLPLLWRQNLISDVLSLVHCIGCHLKCGTKNLSTQMRSVIVVILKETSRESEALMWLTLGRLMSGLLDV